MKEKNKQKINIYKVAGKIGKVVKKWENYAIGGAVVFLVTKSLDTIKKIKK